MIHSSIRDLAKQLGLSNVLRYWSDHFRAECPAHHDRHWSLVVSRSLTGTLLFTCNAGCSATKILRALPSPTQKVPSDAKTEVEVYTYISEEGEYLYERVRYEPKDFRLRRKLCGDHIYNLQGVRLVPYRLPELLKALKFGEKTVFFTEGEKDCDRLRDLGFAATSFKGWRYEFNRWLDKSISAVIVQDHDIAGMKMARKAAATLARHVNQVKILNVYSHLPITDKSGPDISDWLSDGHTEIELLSLVRALRPFDLSQDLIIANNVAHNAPFKRRPSAKTRLCQTVYSSSLCCWKWLEKKRLRNR